MRRKPLLQRFQMYFNPGDENACWEWLGPTQSHGYGVLIWRWDYKLRRMLAHRFAYEHHHGCKIPSRISCCHRCDNPVCVNPAHLFLATHAGNMADMAAKGRSGLRGSKSPLSKLTEKQVAELRRRMTAGEIPNALAKEFGMHRQTIYDIRDRKLWAHVR